MLNIVLVTLGFRVGMYSEDDAIIGEICDYAEKYQVKEMLQEYLKRIILEKPDNPLEFLLKSIQKDPFVPQAQQQKK